MYMFQVKKTFTLKEITKTRNPYRISNISPRLNFSCLLAFEFRFLERGPLHYQTIKSLIYQPSSIVVSLVLKIRSLFYDCFCILISSDPLPSGFSPSSSSSSSSTPLAPPLLGPSFSFASGSLQAHSDLQSIGTVRTILFLVVEGQQSPPSHQQCLLLFIGSHRPSAISAFLQPGIHCKLAGFGYQLSFGVRVHLIVTLHLTSFPCKMKNPCKKSFFDEVLCRQSYKVTINSHSKARVAFQTFDI